MGWKVVYSKAGKWREGGRGVFFSRSWVFVTNSYGISWSGAVQLIVCDGLTTNRLLRS